MFVNTLQASFLAVSLYTVSILAQGYGSCPGGGNSPVPVQDTSSTPQATKEQDNVNNGDTSKGCSVQANVQCGGRDFTGCTTCADGMQCTFFNDCKLLPLPQHPTPSSNTGVYQGGRIASQVARSAGSRDASPVLGAKLLQMIQDGKRPIKLPSDLSDWQFAVPRKQDKEHGVYGLPQPMLDEFGYSNLQADDFVTRIASQTTKFKLDKETHYPTHGFYRSEHIIREDMHIIIATQSNSPRYVVGKDNPVPLLNQWSDWTWAVWETLCRNYKKSTGDLRYILHNHITTLGTRMIMHKITGIPMLENIDLYLDWPGRLFTMDQDEGLALLGSAQGQGIAYFIRDHSDQIQTKKPTVRMWTIVHPAWREHPGFGHYYLLWDLKPQLPFGARHPDSSPPLPPPPPPGWKPSNGNPGQPPGPPPPPPPPPGWDPSQRNPGQPPGPPPPPPSPPGWNPS
ncbi:MAG: hypothetical protein Q9223_004352 [Gallowayella weberi]